MATVNKDILIKAPVEKVYQYLLDVSQFTQWNVGLQSAEPAADFPKVGSKIAAVYKSTGMSFNVALVLQELKPQEVIAYTIEGMITGSSRYTLKPEKGSTRVSVLYKYEIPGGGVGKLLDKLMLERTNAHNQEKSLQQLKGLLEK